MKIACLSGKGGAGKTFLAVNLAVAAEAGCYIDCDVEEPNGRLFLKPEEIRSEKVCTRLPVFDESKCSGCKKCVEFCRFHALAYVREKPMVFSEVCHSCGGCVLVCPEGAVREQPRPIGTLEVGHYRKMKVVTGVLTPGEASGVPVIGRALAQAEGLTVIDCPPGSACSVMESVRAADFCLLVAEPTAFGLHNLQMVCELVSLLKKPCGVVINKEDGPFEPLERFCGEKELPILARIPYDPRIAAMAAGGGILCEKDGKVRDLFRALLNRIGGCL